MSDSISPIRSGIAPSKYVDPVWPMIGNVHGFEVVHAASSLSKYGELALFPAPTTTPPLRHHSGW